jgi:hypothetical protein
MNGSGLVKWFQLCPSCLLFMELSNFVNETDFGNYWLMLCCNVFLIHFEICMLETKTSGDNDVGKGTSFHSALNQTLEYLDFDDFFF